MKLIDLISLVSDGTTVTLHGMHGLEIARYDGKDSIPEQFNDFEIDTVSVDRHGELRIDICTDVIEDGWSAAVPIERYYKKFGNKFPGNLAFLDFRFEAYGDSKLFMATDGSFYYSYMSIGD